MGNASTHNVLKVHIEQMNALNTQKYKEILHLVNTELILRFETCHSASNVTEGQAESVGGHDAGRHPRASPCTSQGLDVWSPAVRTSIEGEVLVALVAPEVGPEAQLPACAPVRVPPSPAWRAPDGMGQPFGEVYFSRACWLRPDCGLPSLGTATHTVQTCRPHRHLPAPGPGLLLGLGRRRVSSQADRP